MTPGVYSILFKGQEVALFRTDGQEIVGIRNLPKDLDYQTVKRMMHSPYYKIVKKADRLAKSEYPPLRLGPVGEKLHDLSVDDNIDNIGSVAATYDNYEVGDIREVGFDELPHQEPYSKHTADRVKSLAENIKQNKKITPLIVGYNEETGDAHILEGNHRHAALHSLGYSSFPALIVKYKD